MTSSDTEPVDLLILGGGWTWEFLQPLLDEHHSDLTYCATTRDGRNGTLKWAWDPEDENDEQYEILPKAKTVIIVFPIKGTGGSKKLVQGYENATESNNKVRWIQLGSTGIFDGGPTLAAQANDEKKHTLKWTDRHSEYDTANARAVAEDELLALRENSFVLNLSGLWGGKRDPANWFERIAPTKEALEKKGSVHFIHGLDVARAIIAVHNYRSTSTLTPPQYSAEISISNSPKLLGQRYILTDLRCYDWWDLASAWAQHSAAENSLTRQAGEWVIELMQEHKIRALPRTPEELGRALDSREFWADFGLAPTKGRWERARL